MWWADPRPWMIAGLVALSVTLGGCGFQPLYGETRGAVLQQDLGVVRVALIKDRAGQLLRRYITERIHPGDRLPPAAYQLEVALTETRQNYGIQRDLSATYARLVIGGNWMLRDLRTGQAVTSGSLYSSVSYNVAVDPFNTVVAESDARERAVRSLGDDIMTRLSVFLRNPHGDSS